MSTKRSLLTSCLALFLCFAMLLGTTFAWFTDTVTSSGNKIKSGSLKLDLKVLTEVIESDGSTHNDWVSIKNEQSPLFTYENWEPGYTDVTILKVENLGTLALKWEARFASEQPLSALAEVIDVYVKPGVEEYPDDRANLVTEGWDKVGNLKQFVNTISETTYGYLDGILTVGGTSSATLGIALKMREEAGNEYQNLTLGEFDIRIVATQATAESDSFGDDYDENAQWPQFSGSADASAPVNTDSTGKVTEETTVTNESGSISAIIPEGVLMTPGTKNAGLSVSEKEESEANLLTVPGEDMLPIDVHIDGVAEGNTVPIAVTVKALLPVGLNAGNYVLRHVEDGVTYDMTLLKDGDAIRHNTYTYNPATGDVTLYMASFSEVAVIAYSNNKWNGNYDFSWYENAVSYKIANADQLAAFSAIVGGMKMPIKNAKGEVTGYKQFPQNSFKDKVVTLIADINIGDVNTPDYDASANGYMFYPIGYWNNTEKYEKQSGNVGPDGSAVSSGFQAFQGTFDGNGHTISGFYQNTWEAFGDYNDGYSGTPNHNRDGFGLFGKVYGGIVKNLTVDNFSSDGEFTTTGVIAAYADCGAVFENIAITNCNPRVYNIGNGGIVGCVGWYNNEKNKYDPEDEDKLILPSPVTFKNITVDNSNKITALWGSWDVACGGIVGQYYPTSGQSAAGYPTNGGMYFENCHSSAVMDVYNDVCANYQYYAYRYSGLFIGSVRENETKDGHVYPKMDGITAKDCTVHFGDWNDYYYCEIVANSLASYTHDHQMSRLTQVAKINDAKTKYLPLGVADTEENWKPIPTSGWAHYVVVKNIDNKTGKFIHGDGETYATCYHFNNGKVHNHKDYNGDGVEDYETVNGNSVYVEDKQLIYREFNNLVTGYGWGVTSKGIDDLPGVTNFDAEAKNPQGDSYEKFVAKTPENTQIFSNSKYLISDFFEIKKGYENDVVLATVTVSAKNLDTNDQVIVNMHRGSNWDNTYVEFLNAGKEVALTIQDYYYCIPTTTSAKFDIFGRFLLHNDSFSQKDDFSEEWIVDDPDPEKISNFKTSGKTTYYYIDYAKEGGTNSRFSNYFYVETDITIHEILNGAQWPKIGFMSGGHYKDIGQTEGRYRMTTFYLAANRSKYNNATGKWDLIDKEDQWYQFGVSEVYNQYGWGWNLENDTIFSNSHVASLPSDMYGEMGEVGKITFNETFKIGLLRDGLNYHFFVGGQYLYTYQIHQDSELYDGREIATDIGFFHFDSKVTYSNYKIYRFADRASMVSHDVVGNHLNRVGTTDSNKFKPTTGELDWCYHTFIHYAAKGATCGEAGNIEYNHCVKCNKNYGPNASTQGRTSEAMKEGTEIIPALGTHAWDDNVCTSCGKYKIIVNHLNLDKTKYKDQETVVLEDKDGIVTYTVDKASLAGLVPSHDYVMVDVTDNNDTDEITIYYSEIDTWDGSTVTTTPLQGDGTEDKPYLIQSAADLAYLATLIKSGANETSGQHYKMTKSIDLAKYDLYLGTKSTWTSDRASFLGYFDGNNCTIRGIEQDNFLFAIIENGYLKNLSFYGTLKCNTSSTGVIGYMHVSHIENITNYVNVSGAGNMGGIVGNMEQAANKTSKNLVNYGNVTGSNAIGGIAGLFGGNIENAVNWGTVTGTTNVGGIVGSLFFSTSDVKGCKNYGDVKGTTGPVGGIGGNVAKEYNKQETTVSISDCTNYGIICGTNAAKITLNPDNHATVTNCNAYGSVHHYSNAPTVSGGTITYTCSICGVTKVENNVPVWDGSVSNSLATLHPVTEENPAGSENNPYLISSGADLLWIDQQMTTADKNYFTGVYFMMTKSIDLGGKSLTIGEAKVGWDTSKRFNGTFDGNGYSVVNLKIEGSSDNSVGLFPLTNLDATIKNLTVHGEVSGSATNVGGIVGFNHRGTLENCVSYVTVTSTKPGACVGGIAGLSNIGADDMPEIINCVNFGTVTGTTNVGGIAGQASGKITGCANYGSVVGDANVGGVYGSIYCDKGIPQDIIVKESFNDGTVINTTQIPATWDGESVSTSLRGNGTKDDPYLISSGADLAYIDVNMTSAENFTGKYFKMTNSIDLGGNSMMIGECPSWDGRKAFAGNFDGNNFSIVNFNINDATNATGLFGMVTGTVQNLTVYGNIKGSSKTIGGIVGYLYGGTLENCVSYVNVTSTYNVTDAEIGGLVGAFENGTIKNCTNYGNVSGNTRVGGIVGYASGTIEGCAFYGSFTGIATVKGNIYGAKRSNGTLTVDGKAQ